MVRYRLRKDKLISDENVFYEAYGVNVYEGWRRVKTIKDVSLHKKRLADLIKKCNRGKVQPNRIEDILQQFVDDEHTVDSNKDSITEKPYSLI